MNRVFDSMTAARRAASAISPSHRRSDAAFARPGAASAVSGSSSSSGSSSHIGKRSCSSIAGGGATSRSIRRLTDAAREPALESARFRSTVAASVASSSPRGTASRQTRRVYSSSSSCILSSASDGLTTSNVLRLSARPPISRCDRRNSRTGPSCGSILPMPQSASCSAGSSVRGVAVRSTTIRDRHATACAAIRRSDRAEAVCASSRTTRSQRTSSRGRSASGCLTKSMDARYVPGSAQGLAPEGRSAAAAFSHAASAEMHSRANRRSSSRFH